MKHKKIIVIILIVLLIFLSRFMFYNSEQGIDSFRTHYMAEYIQDKGYSAWMLNFLSLFGLYPYSYPSGISYLLTTISTLTNINLETTIQMFSFVVTLLGTLWTYFLAKIIFKKENVALLSAVLFAFVPLFLQFTLFTISTRSPFIVLVPMLIWLLIKYDLQKQNKYLWMFIVTIIILATIHRMFVYILLFIIPAYFLKKIILYWKDNKFIRKYLVYILATMIIILFLVQFSNIGPYKMYKWTYINGNYLNAGTKSDYLTGNLNNFVIFINMCIDYISNTGLVLIFSILTLVLIAINIKKQEFEENKIFLFCIILFSVPFLINGYYTNIFLLTILTILGSYGIIYVIQWMKMRWKYIFLTLFILLSIGFSIFMIKHWDLQSIAINRENDLGHQDRNSLYYISENYQGAILVSDPILNQRMRAYSSKPLLPADSSEDIALLQYKYINQSDIIVSKSLKYLITPTKSFIRLEQENIESDKDWETLIIHGVNNPANRIIRSRYNLKYVLETKGEIIRSHWIFYKDIHEEKNKIYDNNLNYIYYVN